MKSITTFFKLKQNLDIHFDSLPTSRQWNTVNHAVNDFMQKADEEVSIFESHGCLSIVPLSRVPFMNQVLFSKPLDKLEELDINENNLDETFMSEQFTLLSEGTCEEPPEKKRLIHESKATSQHYTRSIKLEKEQDCKRKRTETRDDPDDDYDLLEEMDSQENKEWQKQTLRKIKNENIDSSNFRQLTQKENIYLKEQIKAGKINSNCYQCQLCMKPLSCYYAIQYHIISQHIKRTKDPSKIWVGKKIVESLRYVRGKGGKKFNKWTCVICEKDCASAPSIRYHLKKHFQNGEKEGLKQE